MNRPISSRAVLGSVSAESLADAPDPSFPDCLVLAGLWLGLIAWAMVGVMWSPL